MENTKYELTYIIRPDIDSESKKKLIDRFDNILKDSGAEIADSKDWAVKRFAYEINGYKDGMYHIITFSASNDKGINEFDRLAKISSDILRHMIVKREF